LPPAENFAETTPSERFSLFLIDSQLEKREETLRAAGYAEMADLDAASDEDLAQLGLNKPEISRLRRYLSALK